MRRPNRGRFGAAFLASAVAHAGVLGLFWLAAESAEAIPDMRVYAVDIVSPPPQEAGEPEPRESPPVEETPVEETPVEEAEESPPEPLPAPPAPAREPSEAAPARKQPQPKPEARPEPAEPEEQAPARDRSRPSRGADPDPSAESGENLTVKFDGVRCIEPDYCDNIIRQIHRYFRRPAGGTSGEADLYFVIMPEGSVRDLRVISSTGGVPFRLAVMEAVEQAGRNRAFGPLPSGFGGSLPVRFTFRPAR